MPRSLTPDEVAQFRERLIDAAEHLFAVHGAESVTLRQLATALGVSAMTPYRYFKDRDAILAAVRARAFDRHAEALETARAAPSSDIMAKTAAVGGAYVRFAFEHPEAYKLMFDVRQPSAESYPDLVRARARSHATMTAWLYDLEAAGLFHGDVGLVGHLYWAALHGPIMLQLSDALDPPFEARKLVEGLTAVLTKTFIG